MTLRTSSLLPLLLVLASCPPTAPDNPTQPGSASASSTPTAAIAEAAPGGRLVADVVPSHYRLELQVDPNKPTFTGRVRIAIDTAAAHTSLFLHGKDLTIRSAKVLTGQASQSAKVSTIPEEAMLRLDLEATLPAGKHTLDIEYEAPFGAGLAGLYRVEVGGRWYAYTQFEALDARAAFPCFDEPAFKTPFDVALVVPTEDIAIGNTLVAEDKASADTRRVSFTTTEKLPTYLVAFAVGPFDVVEARSVPPSELRKRDVPLRGIAVKGKGHLLAKALEVHAKVLPVLEEYFGIAYPFDKLDFLAVPDFSAGGMENAGAIAYRDSIIFYDPVTSGVGQYLDLVGVAAHEVAHQWFGDLVTMKWWDDLWLNEAFATWMGERVMKRFADERDLPLDFLDSVQGAMDTDSLVSARKIRQPIEAADDVENAFDDLTYSKGAGLIAMFAAFTGDGEFQRGVRRYIEQHRFGSATTDDFLADVFDRRNPKVPLAFKQFLDRPGVPRVTFDMNCKSGHLESVDVRVERYLPLGSTGDPSSDWLLPLCLFDTSSKPCQVLETKSGQPTNVPFSSSACPKFLFPNPDGVAYLRVMPQGEAPTKALVDEASKGWSASSQLAVLDSVRAAYRAGTIDSKTLLEVLPKFTDPKLIPALSNLLGFVSDNVVATADRTAFEAYASKVFTPGFKRYGWEERKGEGQLALRRKDALEAMFFLVRHKKIRAEAVERTRDALGIETIADPDRVPSEALQATMIVTIQDGNQATFDNIVARFKASDDPTLRRAFLTSIARATSPERAAAARALATDPALRGSERLRFVFDLFSVGETRASAWQWFRTDFAKIFAAIPDTVRGYLPVVVESLCDASLEAEIRATFAPTLKSMVGGTRSLDNAIEKMKICDAIARRQGPSLREYLKR